MSGLLGRFIAKRPTTYAPPSALAYQSSTSTTIDFNWTNGAAQPTEIYRNGVLVTTVSIGTANFHDTGLTDSTAYNYMLRHKNGTAYSPMSVNVAMATSLPNPGTLSASVVLRTVSLLWTNTTPFASIVVVRGGSTLTTLAPGTTTYDDTGLADGTYAYTIHYSLGGNVSADSNEVDPVVAATVNEPTGMSATATSGVGDKIDLAWTLGTAGAATEVYRGTAANPTTLIATTSASATTFQDTGLSPNTTYHYRLKGTKGGVQSVAYTTDFSALTHNPPTAAPSGLGNTIPFTDRVSLTWTNGDVAASTNIYRDGALIVNVAAAGTTYNDDTALAGHTYSYTAKHLKDSIESAASAASSAAVPANAFASQSISAAVGATDATMTWTILHGPRSATVDQGAWDDGDGDTGILVAGVASPYAAPLSFTVRGKNPGFTHEVLFAIPLLMRDGLGNIVLTDSSFLLDIYKDN